MKLFFNILKFIILIIFSALLITGCKNKNFNIYEKINHTSVLIHSLGKSTESLGSGVIIGKDGYILTNYHVVYSADSISVKFNSGLFSLEGLNAPVVEKMFLDKDNDLAVIKLNKRFRQKQVAQFESINNIFKGQHVYAVGTPLDDSLYNLVMRGIVSNRNISEPIRMKYLDGTATTLQLKNLNLLDFQTNGGNSGGPVFNYDGKLSGIITGSNKEQRISFAISLEEINKFLKDKGIINK
jgi:serine protease Do